MRVISLGLTVSHGSNVLVVAVVKLALDQMMANDCENPGVSMCYVKGQKMVNN